MVEHLLPKEPMSGIDWLFDYECEALFGVEEPDADAVCMGDEPCVFATADVILRWIQEGKPKKTSWEKTTITFIKG